MFEDVSFSLSLSPCDSSPSRAGFVKQPVNSISAHSSAWKKSFDSYFLLVFMLNSLSPSLLGFIVQVLLFGA